MNNWFEKNKNVVMKALGFMMISASAFGLLYFVVSSAGGSTEVEIPVYWMLVPLVFATLYGYYIARKAEMLEVEKMIDRKLQEREAIRAKESISPPPSSMAAQDSAAEPLRH